MAANWKESWQKHTDNPPKPGDILKAYGDVPARLDIELQDGKPPFVYGRVYVPCIVGHELGWFLQPADSTNAHGWKCILLPKAREEALRKLGMTKPTVAIKSLKVIRKSQTGGSLLCEIAEYL
jgi:hypothetical protein